MKKKFTGFAIDWSEEYQKAEPIDRVTKNNIKVV